MFVFYVQTIVVSGKWRLSMRRRQLWEW